MATKIEILEDLTRLLLVLMGGATLSAMAFIAVSDGGADFSFKVAFALLMMIVFGLNKEREAKDLIRAWRGGKNK